MIPPKPSCISDYKWKQMKSIIKPIIEKVNNKDNYNVIFDIGTNYNTLIFEHIDIDTIIKIQLLEMFIKRTLKNKIRFFSIEIEYDEEKLIINFINKN